MSRERVLLVDGANVVGSRPDGWWRDRAGAAAGLRARLAAAHVGGRLGVDRVVLVLEGRARPGAPAGRREGVEVVHAVGEGDDEIVRRAVGAVQHGSVATVVSADRGLADRVRAGGAEVVGPRWLLDRLDAVPPGRRD